MQTSKNNPVQSELTCSLLLSLVSCLLNQDVEILSIYSWNLNEPEGEVQWVEWVFIFYSPTCLGMMSFGSKAGVGVMRKKERGAVERVGS